MISVTRLSAYCSILLQSLGFQISDGLLYTYVSGNEYIDIQHVWDWNLLPGITTDYAGTPLRCADQTYYGLEDFVGGAAIGNLGVAAMRYTNPMTHSFYFQKAWFFLQGGRQHVMVSDAWSNGTQPVYSVLDRKRKRRAILVDDVDVYAE